MTLTLIINCKSIAYNTIGAPAYMKNDCDYRSNRDEIWKDCSSSMYAVVNGVRILIS